MAESDDGKHPTRERTAESRDDRIRTHAYYLYLARGGDPGYELDDWLRAEQQEAREEEAARQWRLTH